MRGVQVPILIISIAILLVSNTADALDIFVWDHDNDIVITDEVFDEDYTCIQSMIRTLDELGYDYTLYDGWFLPNNLTDYDLVIFPLGTDGCG